MNTDCRGNRRNVDDRPGALSHHLKGSQLRTYEMSLKVDGEYLVPIRLRNRFKGLNDVDRSVVHEHVEARKLAQTKIDQLLTASPQRNVHECSGGYASGIAYLSCGLFGLIHFDVADDDFSAKSCQSVCYTLSDALP